MSKNNVFLSIIIPAHNEENCISATCVAIITKFELENITDYEILVVNDNSKDQTEQILRGLCIKYPVMRYVNNTPPNGFGFAVQKGLEEYYGDTVLLAMADLSDSPSDMLVYYRELRK
jgi:dolichol-phosphate mannosyltransferase